MFSLLLQQTGNLPPKSGTNWQFFSGTLTVTEFSGGGSNLTSVDVTTLDSIDGSLGSDGMIQKLQVT